MPDLHLKTAIQTLGHTRALKDGTVTPQGFSFDFEEVAPIIQAFRRMARGSEFDVSEMAMTTYLCARAAGKRITALPVFLVRAFHHGAVLHNAARGSFEPKQLEGKRVGVNRGYTVTTGVWARGVLQHQYGVDLSKITWVLSGDEHVAEFMAPSNVVRIEPGQQLDQMLLSGEIAAATGLATDHPDLKPLIPDAKAAGFAALMRDGYYPINHTVVVRDELLEAHPQLAAQLFDAFAEAKRLYVDAPARQRDRRADRRRSAVRARHADHRRRSAAVRRRAEPADAGNGDAPGGGAGHHRRALPDRTTVRRRHAAAGRLTPLPKDAHG